MRFEVNPYAAVTMNDQFVAHNGPGIEGNFYIINPLAIGVNFTWYGGLNSQSDFNFQTSRAARIGQPITEYQLNANLNLTYVFAYGKLAAFQDFIFHYDFFVKAGGGVISTRPIAVVDPDNRTFNFEVTGTWNVGGGIRIFFTRWLAATLEIRDYMFLDRLENPAIATGFDSDGNPRAQDESTWLADGREFTNNVQAQFGLSFFLPPTWEYELPK
jgi:outer membrane beta-barrel protein